MSSNPESIYTIGHSNHSVDDFIRLIREHKIEALVDVRSSPYSRYNPQFSKEALKAAVCACNVKYVFLGLELGARTDDPSCYKHGRVQYERLASTPLFMSGVNRVLKGASRYRIALMCAEKDPIECHRAVLVARKLFEMGVPVRHIRADGSVEEHGELETRLLAICNLPEGDMFKTRKELLTEAYAAQGERIAYVDKSMVEAERAGST